MSQFTQDKLTDKGDRGRNLSFQGREYPTTKAMEKAIKASIKKEIVARGINTTTRKGNKELKFLVSKLASQSLENLEQAKIVGEKMGQHLSELLQQKNKQNLDAGLIRQVSSQKDFWSLVGLSATKPRSIKVSLSEESYSQTPAAQTTEEAQPTETTSPVSDAETEEAQKTTIKETPNYPKIENHPNETAAQKTFEAAIETSNSQEDLSQNPPAQSTEEIESNQATSVVSNAEVGETSEITTPSHDTDETVEKLT